MSAPPPSQIPQLSARLRELARRIQSRPWNASGSDETRVLHALLEHQRFQREARQARKLLQSKAASGRPKDLEFLRAFQARAEERED